MQMPFQFTVVMEKEIQNQSSHCIYIFQIDKTQNILFCGCMQDPCNHCSRLWVMHKMKLAYRER